MITRTDENTGREVRQLTNLASGVLVPYFRLRRHLPDGRVICLCGPDEVGANPGHTGLAVIDPESGDFELLKRQSGAFVTLLPDGRAIFYERDGRKIWALKLPDGAPEQIGAIPEDAPGDVITVTCDGRTVILMSTHLLQSPDPKREGDDEDAGVFWRHIYRPRSADLYAYDLVENSLTLCVHLDRYSFQHVDPSPADPRLLKFAQDGLAVFDQRIHAVNTDGSELRKIRPQEKGEWVHHEFWWPGGQFIGYKYVDRRNDATIHELPWGELAPRPLQLGIADLSGQEVYLSDPLSCYHSHLHVSPKGDMISGEGTLHHSFVYAGEFSWADSRINLQPLATTHTPYKLNSAQSVEAGFSADSRWLIYNDTIDGRMQVCAVKV